MAAIIETRDLCFSYAENGPRALENVSLSFEEGSFTAVLGHNGSGKSTFAKLLNAILLPSAGKVLVGGWDTTDESRLFDIRATAGMVFQNPDNQIVATVVEEDVAFACENQGLPPAEIRRRVDESLAAVGMTEFAHHAPHLLSGGQKQRVAIAGVLAMEPRAIIMDEPTAMLDPSGRAEVLRAIRRLNRERGITIILITHHMDEAALAGRVVVLNHGRVALDGAPRDIFCQVARMKELKLAVPQTVELLSGLEGCDLHALSVEECAAEIIRYLGE